jgi:hypothetical protein
MVGVGTYNIAGARDCNIIGPRFPVVVIDIILTPKTEINSDMKIGRRT